MWNFIYVVKVWDKWQARSVPLDSVLPTSYERERVTRLYILSPDHIIEDETATDTTLARLFILQNWYEFSCKARGIYSYTDIYAHLKRNAKANPSNVDLTTGTSA
jgi:hypothetical protein